jgi:muramoyltetrapeptide carboxypeptidase LdcA involved in peptidoglycan recycling
MESCLSAFPKHLWQQLQAWNLRYLEPIDLSNPCWRNESNRYRNGRISGRKFIYSLQFIRSPSAIDCKDKILFIEDLDEYLYHIDRMMMNLNATDA